MPGERALRPVFAGSRDKSWRRFDRLSAAAIVAPMSVARSPINALHWIGTVAAFGATIFYWDGFSGPFRWLVDLQVALTARYYWEPLAVAVLLSILLCGVVTVAGLLDPIVPRFKARTWGWLLLVALTLGSGAALAQAWHMWSAPPGPLRPVPPLRVLDLDRLDVPDASFGPVRLLGRADPRDRVKLPREPRGYNIYQPLAGRRRDAADMPVPVIAVCYSRYGGACTPAALEGWLFPGGSADRDSYRLRRAGVLTGARHYLLSPGLPTYDTYRVASDRDRGGAVAIVLSLALFWAVAVFAWIRSLADAQAPRTPAPVIPPQPQPPFPDSNLYVFALVVSAFIVVFLSVLGVVRWVIQLLP